MDVIVQLVVTGMFTGVLDALWLGVIAKTLYRSQLGNLLLDKPNMPAAIGFYVIYVIGVVAFVVHPALSQDSLQYALLYGALFGFVAYATYDLTNLATLKRWPLNIVLMDVAWGTVLTAAVSVLTYGVVSAWLS